MLRLSRKTDYALMSLAWLTEHTEHVWSAREIAGACQMPVALVMNVLKILHQKGVLRSIRGTNGGYQIAVDLSKVSLFDLMQMLDKQELESLPIASRHPRGLALHGAAQALQYRLGRFMREVSVAD